MQVTHLLFLNYWRRIHVVCPINFFFKNKSLYAGRYLMGQVLGLAYLAQQRLV